MMRNNLQSKKALDDLRAQINSVRTVLLEARREILDEQERQKEINEFARKSIKVATPDEVAEKVKAKHSGSKIVFSIKHPKKLLSSVAGTIAEMTEQDPDYAEIAKKILDADAKEEHDRQFFRLIDKLLKDLGLPEGVLGDPTFSRTVVESINGIVLPRVVKKLCDDQFKRMEEGALRRIRRVDGSLEELELQKTELEVSYRGARLFERSLSKLSLKASEVGLREQFPN